MKILKMRLENFQGVKELEIDPQGESSAIYGDNGTGKSTVYIQSFDQFFRWSTVLILPYRFNLTSFNRTIFDGSVVISTDNTASRRIRIRLLNANITKMHIFDHTIVSFGKHI